MSTKVSVQIKKKFFVEDIDEDQEAINESWQSFFEENLKMAPGIFISQDLIAPGYFLYSVTSNKLTELEIEKISKILNESPGSFDISYANEKYTFIKKFDPIHDDDFPLFCFTANSEISEEDGQKVLLFVQFVTEDLIFVAKCAKKHRSDAIFFIQENYRYEMEDEE
ncbi:hypothetical protein M153_14838000596 [Pseudoloma neurophilia]|uniref:Uncharacterized protein n=1 Tax=Pseudoloma neurophilia TaxID=146866 RepID=A0A0R0LRB5_9MICR|nr:hypothetical protein M153_14838000596 [Pseudoloma neurophilia]